MSLNIGGATIGYDTGGLTSLISAVNTSAISPAITTIRNQAEVTKNTLDTVWVGESANAFKQKIDKDTNTLCNALNDLSAAVEAQLNTAGANVEDYDAEIARQLFGAAAGGSGSPYTKSPFVNNDDNSKKEDTSKKDSSNNNGNSNGSSPNTSDEAPKEKKSLWDRYVDFTNNWFSYDTVVKDETTGEEKVVKQQVNPYGGMEDVGKANTIIYGGFFEGVGKFGEKTMDAVLTVPLWVGSLFSEESMQGLREFVATDHVKGGFDKFFDYADVTDFYGFDTTRKITNTAGEVTATVAVAALTAGAGAGAAGSSELAATAAAEISEGVGVSAAREAAAIAAKEGLKHSKNVYDIVSRSLSVITGFGSGTADALKNSDVSVGQAFAGGVLTGAVNGLKMYALGKAGDVLGVGNTFAEKTLIAVEKDVMYATTGIASSYADAVIKTGYASASEYNLSKYDNVYDKFCKIYKADNGGFVQGFLTNGVVGISTGTINKIASESLSLLRTGGFGASSDDFLGKVLKKFVSKEFSSVEEDSISFIADAF